MTQVYKPMSGQGGRGRWGLVALMAVVSLVVIWVMARTFWGVLTMQYTLTDASLEIVYGPTRVEIPRADIVEVETVLVTDGRRVMGTGMSGLQEGRWSFAETGSIRLYSTSTNPLTVVTTKTGRWGISPDDPRSFVTAVRSGAAGRWDPVPSNGRTAAGLLGVAVVLVMLGTTALTVYGARGPQDMAYVLAEDALEVRVPWTKVRVPYQEIEAVETASPAGYPMKLFGASMPGFYWGSFRWKTAGSGLKLYSTGLQPLVLVRTATRTYGITPADPEGLVAELKRRLG